MRGRRGEEWIMDDGLILLQGIGRPDAFYTSSEQLVGDKLMQIEARFYSVLT